MSAKICLKFCFENQRKSSGMLTWVVPSRKSLYCPHFKRAEVKGMVLGLTLKQNQRRVMGREPAVNGGGCSNKYNSKSELSDWS